jgi:hypothetical protein
MGYRFDYHKVTSTDPSLEYTFENVATYGKNNNNNKHAYACNTDSFTHLRLPLVLTDRDIFARFN